MQGMLLLADVTLMLFIGVSTHGPYWVLYGVTCSVLMCWPEHALQMIKNPYVPNSNYAHPFPLSHNLDNWLLLPLSLRRSWEHEYLRHTHFCQSRGNLDFCPTDNPSLLLEQTVEIRVVASRSHMTSFV